MNHIYVMVTGPSAAGKTTLCKKMCSGMNAYFYKPADAYFDLARIHNIPKERVFYDTNLEELAIHFSNVCAKHEIATGDQHLAIQHNRDSSFAVLGEKKFDIQEPFVAAMDYGFFDTMKDKGIKPIIIHLTANPELLYERAYKRNIIDGQMLRNINLEDVINEVNAEEYYYNDLIAKKNLDNLMIDTTDDSIENIYSKVKQKVLKFK